MHVSLVIALIYSIFTPLVHGIQSHFDSAIYYNICKEKDGSYGPGRVSWRTKEAQCVSTTRFKAFCIRTQPAGRLQILEEYERECSESPEYRVWCVPSSRSTYLKPDCACVSLPTGRGSKPPEDTDGIACSSGIHFDETVTAWSTIVFTSAQAEKEVQGCWTELSGNSASTLNEHYPCHNDANVLTFEAGKTYQTCIEANDRSPSRINWIWQLSGPFGHTKRGLSLGNVTILDHVKIDDTVAFSTQASIVIVDDDSEHVLL